MTNNHSDLIANADVRELKMIDGSSVIAEILAEDGDNILLYDPMQIILEHSTAMFIPWFTTMADRYVQVNKSKTVANATCTFDVKTMYFQALMRNKVKKVMEQTTEHLEFYEDTETPDVVH